MHLLPHLRTYEYEIKTIDSHTEGESPACAARP